MTIDLRNKLSGFADEAGDSLDVQIQAHRELGWRYVDLRTIGRRELTEISDEEFAEVADRLRQSGLQVSSFGSPIGNRKCSIGEPLEKSLADLDILIPRMKRLGTRLIRVMTYVNDGRPDEHWRDEAVARMRELARRAEEAQIFLGVENCAGWAGQSKDNYRAFFDMVGSPALKAVFDLGNPGAKNLPGSVWEWYQAIKPHLMQVHVKVHSGGPGGRYTWPDTGASNIREILRDLSVSAFDGFLSIEPHLGSSDKGNPYETYITYGTMLMKMLRACPPHGNPKRNHRMGDS